MANLRSRSKTTLIYALLPIISLAILRSYIYVEGDSFWETLSGKEILTKHTIFLANNYTFFQAGQTWHPNSWLYNVFLYGCYWLAGVVGLAIAGVLTVLLAGVGIYKGAMKLNVSLLAVGFILLVCGPCLSTSLELRATALTSGFTALMLAWVLVSLRKIGKGFHKAIISIFAFQVLWANIHVGALTIVPVVAVATLVVSLLEKEKITYLKKAIILTLTTLLGSFSTPLGTSIIASSLHTSKVSRGRIIEWENITQIPLIGVTYFVVSLIFTALTFVVWKKTNNTLWAGMFAASLLLSILGADIYRFIPIALLVSGLGGAKALQLLWNRSSTKLQNIMFGAYERLAVVGFLICVSLIGFLAVGNKDSHAMPSSRLVAKIPNNCKVLNTYNDGGIIELLRNKDGIKASIDGRNDFLTYATLQEALSIYNTQDINKINALGINCVVANNNYKIIDALEKTNQWDKIISDDYRTLLVRKNYHAN